MGNHNKPSFNHRSSISGRFVKQDYARKHPSTTEREKRQEPKDKKDK